MTRTGAPRFNNLVRRAKLLGLEIVRLTTKEEANKRGFHSFAIKSNDVPLSARPALTLQQVADEIALLESFNRPSLENSYRDKKHRVP